MSKPINQPPEQQTKQTNDEFVVVAVTMGVENDKLQIRITFILCGFK